MPTLSPRVLFPLCALAFAALRAAASPAPPPPPPQKTPTLAEFLKKELGARFHPRSEWAVGAAFRVRHEPPRTWEPIGEVKYITLHQADGIPLKSPAAMIRDIYLGHTASNGKLGGAPDVAYHFFVDRKGEVWEGRDATKKGSHVKSTPAGLNNEGNIGICALDTFNYTDPIKPIQDSVARLCELICKHQARTLQVTGHQDWRGVNQKNNKLPLTWCPGNLEKLVPTIQKKLVELYGPIPKTTRQIAVAQENKFAPGRPKPKAKPKGKAKTSTSTKSKTPPKASTPAKSAVKTAPKTAPKKPTPKPAPRK